MKVETGNRYRLKDKTEWWVTAIYWSGRGDAVEFDSQDPSQFDMLNRSHHDAMKRRLQMGRAGQMARSKFERMVAENITSVSGEPLPINGNSRD